MEDVSPIKNGGFPSNPHVKWEAHPGGDFPTLFPSKLENSNRPKTLHKENFRLLYNTKGRFMLHKAWHGLFDKWVLVRFPSKDGKEEIVIHMARAKSFEEMKSFAY